MGDPKKPKKKWIGPSHPWIKEVLMEEMELSCDSGKEPKGETLFMQTENHRLAIGITISESKA